MRSHSGNPAMELVSSAHFHFFLVLLFSMQWWRKGSRWTHLFSLMARERSDEISSSCTRSLLFSNKKMLPFELFPTSNFFHFLQININFGFWRTKLNVMCFVDAVPHLTASDFLYFHPRKFSLGSTGSMAEKWRSSATASAAFSVILFLKIFLLKSIFRFFFCHSLFSQSRKFPDIFLPPMKLHHG